MRVLNKIDRSHYSWWVQLSRLRFPFNKDRAMQFAIGGEFEAFGFIETELLRHAGLRKSDYVIDVGCGSGRLAKPLAGFLEGAYLGTDIVPELVSYAKKLVNRPDWRFQVVKRLEIPEKDGQADFVCFFSVLTHLSHEDSYRYLREAR